MLLHQQGTDITLTTRTSLPLLCVPGLMCNATVWDPVLPRLATVCQATVCEQGDADSLTGLAQQLLAQAPAHMLLAGHSMGARIVLEAVRLAPQRIHGVALLDTGYLPRLSGAAGEEETQKRFGLLRVAQMQGVRAMAQNWVQGMVHPRRLGDTELIERIVTMFETRSPQDFERQIQALLNRPDARTVLQHLQVPTALICGRQDAWSPPAQHEAMHHMVPGSTLTLIDDAGHMAPMEQPDAVAQALSHWLDTCPGARA